MYDDLTERQVIFRAEVGAQGPDPSKMGRGLPLRPCVYAVSLLKRSSSTVGVWAW